MRRKILIACGISGILLTFIILMNIQSSNELLDNVLLADEMVNINGNSYAIYMQSEEGTYDPVDSIPTNGIFNSTLSGCVDNSGNKIIDEDTITYSDSKILISINKSVYCYLYFNIA